MKITLAFYNNGSAIGKFEDDTYTYIHLYPNAKQLAKDYLTVVTDGLDGSELAYWKDNQLELNPIKQDYACIYEENTDEETNCTPFTELDPAWCESVAEFLNAL